MEDPVKDVPVIEEDDHAKQSRIIKTLAKHIAKNCETCPMKLYDNFACKQNTRKCVENIIRHAETHLEPSKKGEEGATILRECPNCGEQIDQRGV